MEERPLPVGWQPAEDCHRPLALFPGQAPDPGRANPGHRYWRETRGLSVDQRADRPRTGRHLDQFGVIRTDQDDAQSAGGQRVDQPIDLEFRANIDALGWLVQDQEPGPGKEPAGDDNLLLVATRQEADALPFSGRV